MKLKVILVVLVVQGILLCSGWSRVIDAFGDQVSTDVKPAHDTSAPQISSDEGSGQENSRTSNEENIHHDGSHKQALPPKADNRRSLLNIKTLLLPQSFLPNIGHRSLLEHRSSAEHICPGANRDRRIVKLTFLFTPPTLSLLKKHRPSIIHARS